MNKTSRPSKRVVPTKPRTQGSVGFSRQTFTGGTVQAVLIPAGITWLEIRNDGPTNLELSGVDSGHYRTIENGERTPVFRARVGSVLNVKATNATIELIGWSD